MLGTTTQKKCSMDVKAVRVAGTDTGLAPEVEVAVVADGCRAAMSGQRFC